MKTLLRDLSALLKQRNIPTERVTLASLTRERTTVTVEYASESDAAELAAQSFGDATGGKFENEASIVWQAEMAFRGHLYVFLFFVPKGLPTLTQERVNSQQPINQR